MSFTDIFIRRPVLASVVSLLILLIGLVAITKLQVRQYPELSSTTITITTAYPGASAELIQGFITTPIQQAVSSTEGIDTIVSNSQQNVSTITLNLLLNASPDRAITDVLSKINQVKSTLPKEALDPVVVKQTGQGTALMYMSFYSKDLNSSQITDYLTRVVQPKLQTVDGVATAQILGGQTFAMRVWLDPDKMAARGVTAADIRNALTTNNFTTAAGSIKGDFTETSINAETSLQSAQAFSRLVVAVHGDTLIRLGNVARIELGPQSSDSSSVFDGLKAVFVGIYSTPTANPLDVINNVRKAFPAIQKELPPGLSGNIAYDATEFIRASIFEVEKTLGEAALIVIVVIFLFLGNLRSTLIPIVTIPLSLIGVMILLLAMNYSVNLLTLLALVLAIGLVVDDAIVVVENIYRHIEEGLSPQDAALKGAREIAAPVITMTVTLAAVYAPIGFVTGVTGALFREFAFTLAGSVIVSGLIALTLSPMMCSKLLKAPSGDGGLAGKLDRLFERLRLAYERRLHSTLNFRALTVLILVGVLALTGIMYASTPKELAPPEDQGILFSLVKTPQYANLDYLEQTTRQMNGLISTIPEKSHIFTINGSAGTHQAFVGILLKNWADRTRAAKDVLQELSTRFAQIPGASVLAFSPPPLPGSTGGPPLQFVVRSTGDYKELASVIAKLQTEAQKSGLFIFTDTDLKFDTPQYNVTIHTSKANQLGISMQDIGTTLATMLGGNLVNRFDLYGRSYEVIPQAPRKFRDSPDWITRFQLRTATGGLVPLSTVATISQNVQPNALTTFQQLNSATLSGVPFPGRTLGEGINFLQDQAKKLLPAGFTVDYQGDSRQFVQEGNTLVVTFIFALIVIFLVLAAQFESFRDPFVILIALPTSMFGALLPLMILSFAQRGSINIYTQIGLVTLIGLISKHGILMVEFANRLQAEEGYSHRGAIEHAAGVRLRPILMTTAAMVVSMIPLIFASGAGARSRADIGIVIGSGMAIGTLFTLFVTPAIYTLISRDHGHDRDHAPAAREISKNGMGEAAKAAAE
ncbi:MAG: multidrug efflux RND transporter permease subunit [Hyphomicrobiales bacterium]|nr:multidrug efflux RND transporter permease subunit [Hyphomicrobiales bacterium]